MNWIPIVQRRKCCSRMELCKERYVLSKERRCSVVELSLSHDMRGNEALSESVDGSVFEELRVVEDGIGGLFHA